MDDYLKIIFKEVYMTDGLVVMGHGLGIDRVYCKFIQYYSEKNLKFKKPLVFCLNVNNLEDSFVDLLISDGIRPDQTPKFLRWKEWKYIKKITQQNAEIKRNYSSKSKPSQSINEPPVIRVNSAYQNKGSALGNSKGGNPSTVKQTMELFEKELIQNINDSAANEQEKIITMEISKSEEYDESSEGKRQPDILKDQLLLDSKELKQLPLELQLLFIQHRILQLIPSSKSHQETIKAVAATRQQSRKRDIASLKDDNGSEVIDLQSEEDEFKDHYFDPSTYENDKKRNKLYQDTDDQAAHLDYSGEFLLEDESLLIHIVTHHQLKANLCFLSNINPSTILLYDTDVYIVRKIETYQSTQLDRQLKVYFFNYEGSTEEHRYVGFLAKEKKAFESLIRAKEHLVIALPDNTQELLYEKQKDLLETAVDSRSIKTQHFNKLLHRKIVVDVREFRSNLPLLLYNQHFHLVPRTITIGDYVLSPEICVERKGISDLYQSFASGRLYNQIEQMSKYYKYPILLIEFALEKSFCLVASNEITTEIQVNSIISKLVLLIQSFLNLRILWSRSPQQTAEIFRLLMLNHEEVDVQKAVTVGNISNLTGDSFGASEQGVDAGSNEYTVENNFSEKEYYRYSAQEILLSLPGINSQNYRNILNNSSKVKNLADLSNLKEIELSSLIGPVNAKKLYAFFHHK